MDGQEVDGRTVRVCQVRKQGPRFSRDGSFRDGRGGRYGGRGRSPPFRRGSPPFRRRSPYRGRSRSPRNYDYSPQRYSPDRRSRSPYTSRSRSPEDRRPPPRRQQQQQQEEKETKKRTAPEQPPPLRDADGTTKSLDVEALRQELEEKERLREELQDKVSSLEAKLDRQKTSEATIKVKNETLVDKLAAINNTAAERLALLRKIQKAVGKVHTAEEQLKESEKELKTLINIAVNELDTPGNDDHVGVHDDDGDGKVDFRSRRME